ncbi:winged helix-turn-helix domain-containing protein [Thalassotalea ganghwensis]
MSLIRINDIVIHPKLSVLTINQQEVAIEPKLLELLLLFCHHVDQIISREQILDTIWPNSLVTDNAVNKLVASLRKLLNDDSKAPQFIQTVPKRGYRFIASVSFEQTIPAEQQTQLKTELGDTNKPSDKIETVETNNHWPIVFIVLVAIISFIWALGGFSAKQKPTDNVSKNTAKPMTSVALTKLAGWELSPLMSDNQNALFFLREDGVTGHRSLWHKNLANQQETLINGLSPYTTKLIALQAPKLATENATPDEFTLLYLAQENEKCEVAQASFSKNKNNTIELQAVNPIFDCSTMTIFDIEWAKSTQSLFYTAKVNGDHLTRVYQYQPQQKQHNLISQPEVSGLGNRAIDLSPNEDKLLITSINKHSFSQIYALNLITNQLSRGLQVQFYLKNAIWAADGERVIFAKSTPSPHLVLSDFSGEGQQTILNSTVDFSQDLARISGTEELLYSTRNQDYNNRWLAHVNQVSTLNNSTVFEMAPTLAHKSSHYAFISTRNGPDQIYYGDLSKGNSRALTKLNDKQSYQQLSFSPNDEMLLVGNLSHLWLINLNKQLKKESLADLTEYSADFKTPHRTLTATWLTDRYIYIKQSIDGVVKGFVFDRINRINIEVDSRWQVLMTDHKNTEYLYLIDPVDTQIYQLPSAYLAFTPQQSVLKFPEQAITSTQSFIGKPYLDVKVHDSKMYVMTSARSGNTVPYDYQIEVKPIQGAGTTSIETHKVSCSCGYDIADTGFIISEQINIEGDIFRAQKQ